MSEETPAASPRYQVLIDPAIVPQLKAMAAIQGCKVPDLVNKVLADHVRAEFPASLLRIGYVCTPVDAKEESPR